MKISQAIGLILLTCIWGICLWASSPATAQAGKKLLYDTGHGENPTNAAVFEDLIRSAGIPLHSISRAPIKEIDLSTADVLILFSPTEKIEANDRDRIITFLDSGRSMLLIFDEERRTSLEAVGINELIIPYGLQLTDDAPVPHNCGAIAYPSEVCRSTRELPYSGGRSINGGTVISKVNSDGDFVHSAFVRTKAGGIVVVMSDGMAGLLMGEEDGVRFSGTGPSDSNYWGKDSRVFMEDIFAFLLK